MMMKTVFLRRLYSLLGAMIALSVVPSGSAVQVLDLDICEIQGAGFISPYRGQTVRTRGIVTLDLDSTAREGFYLQAGNCDGDAATSDGIFVYLGEQLDVAAVGDDVQVQGWVVEYAGLTELSVSPAAVERLGSGSLPAAIAFAPPWAAAASRAAFEAHEGMRIAIQDASVVGPTTAWGETFVVDTAAGVVRVFQGDQTGAVITIGRDGPFAVTPGAAVGERLLGLLGVLDVQESEFLLQLTTLPSLAPDGSVYRPVHRRIDDLRFAGMNLHNLFDTYDDPNTFDSVLSPSQYQARLEKLARVIADDLDEPFFIGVQEAENGGVLQALANRPEISVQYAFAWQDGPDVRGLDVALLYRPDRVALLSSQARQGCTALVDGLGPDGNLDPLNPANNLTCDLDGQPGPDGNRLFSRPPLMLHLQICRSDCSSGGEVEYMWVIVVHLKSKTQDTSGIAFTLPRRLEQAQFLGQLVAEIQAGEPDAGIVLLGDFNDYLVSTPLAAVSASGLVNLMPGVPPVSRYTYNYRGVSQVLDHIFISQSLAGDPFEILFARPVPVASDYPADLEYATGTSLRASDHDPVLVETAAFTGRIFLPAIYAEKAVNTSPLAAVMKGLRGNRGHRP